MRFQFRSLRSSSSGNCLALWTDATSILLDCGIKTHSGCLDLLRQYTKRVDGVVISHAHGDHIARYPLRIFSERGIPIHGHHEVIGQVHQTHIENGAHPRFHPFAQEEFAIGDFTIQPVPVPHAPGYPTFGFVIWCGKGPNRTKLVVCTDFHDYTNLVEHLADAAFVFVEANHDLDLLRKHWNPSSRYHMSNPKTAALLCRAKQNGRFSPQAVMLGHLSRLRNSDELALDTIKAKFAAEDTRLDFRLEVAPRYEASRIVSIE